MEKLGKQVNPQRLKDYKKFKKYMFGIFSKIKFRKNNYVFPQRLERDISEITTSTMAYVEEK